MELLRLQLTLVDLLTLIEDDEGCSSTFFVTEVPDDAELTKVLVSCLEFAVGFWKEDEEDFEDVGGGRRRGVFVVVPSQGGRLQFGEHERDAGPTEVYSFFLSSGEFRELETLA